MNSTLAPKETDSKDKAATKPDAVATARADRTSARPAREVRPSAAQDRTKSDVPAGKPNPADNSTTARGSSTTSAGRSASAGNSASAGGNSATAGNAASTGKSASADELAPSADATFRAAAVDDGKVARGRPATGRWARRARMGLLLALCSGAAVAGWMHYGDTVKAYGVAVRTMVAKWVPSGAPASSPPQESAGAAEQPGSAVLQADETDQAAVPPAQSAPSFAASAAALPPETTQLLQSMSQQIEQLRAGMEDLKSGQDQIFRYMARNSEPRPAQATSRIPEQNLGPRIPAPPLRTAAAAPVRKPRPAQAAARPGVEPVIRPPLPLR
jgi:hypothetical protein